MKEKLAALRGELESLKHLAEEMNDRVSTLEALLASIEMYGEEETQPSRPQEFLSMDSAGSLFDDTPEVLWKAPQKQDTASQPWRKDRPGTPVADMRSAVTLNDRVLFINTLFDGDPVKFQDAVMAANGMKDIDELLDYLAGKGYDWDMGSDTVYRFMMAARRKLG